MNFIEDEPEQLSSDDDTVTREDNVVGQTYKLDITQAEADANYDLAGGEVEEPPDQISIVKHQQLLLNDKVHRHIMEVLEEMKITFQLADFQMISLHVIGNHRNLVLLSPTGSGKMMVILAGTLLMRKVLGIKSGVSVCTQPLSILMGEKMNDKLVPTAVLSMQGQLKRVTTDESEASLSSPEDEVMKGLFPVLLGHPESWSSDKERLQNQSIVSDIFLFIVFCLF